MVFQFGNLFGQSDEVVTDKATYKSTQTTVSFIGGQDSLTEFLISNLNYPDEAKKANIQGIVWVTFAVKKDSTVGIININSDANLLLANEARRIILLSNKKWIPAKMDGKYISSFCRIPITFELEDDEVYVTVESMPGFKGKSGIDAFIQKNLKRPEGGNDSIIAEGIKFNFIINADGSVSDIEADTAYYFHTLLNYLSPFIKEATRVIKMTDLMWTPAKINGFPVRYRISLVIRFKP